MKNALIVVAVLAVLGIGGYLYLSSRGMVPKSPTAMMGEKAGGVFTSIKDALSKSLSLKCVYKDEEGVETTSYIKAGAVRVMMTSAAGDDQPNNIIMKEKKMHMWNDVTKTGFTFTVEDPKDVTPFPTAKEGDSTYAPDNAQDQESVLAQIEKYKDACKPETVADAMFTVPTDVTFQDMNALQEQMMKQSPQAPSGGTESSGYEEYIKQMMEQQGQ